MEEGDNMKQIYFVIAAVLVIQVKFGFAAEDLDKRLADLTSKISVLCSATETPKPKNISELQELTSHEKGIIEKLSVLSYELSQQPGSEVEITYESGNTSLTQKRETDNHRIMTHNRLEEGTSKSSQNNYLSHSAGSTGGIPIFFPINYSNNLSSGGSSNHSKTTKLSDNKHDEERNQELVFQNLNHGGFKLQIKTTNTLPVTNSQNKITYNKEDYILRKYTQEQELLIAIENSLKYM